MKNLVDDDHNYTLQEANEFEKEVAERLPDFLKEHDAEPGSLFLKEIEDRFSSQCFERG